LMVLALVGLSTMTRCFGITGDRVEEGVRFVKGSSVSNSLPEGRKESVE